MSELERIDLTIKGRAARGALSFIPIDWRAKWLRILADLKEGNAFLTEAAKVNLAVHEMQTKG